MRIWLIRLKGGAATWLDSGLPVFARALATTYYAVGLVDAAIAHMA